MIYLATLQLNVKDKLESYVPVYTKDELNRVVADTSASNKIIIRRDFIQKYFTPKGLQLFVKEIKTLNRSLIVKVEDDKSLIDSSAFVEKISKIRNIEELIYLACKYPNEMLDNLHMLTDKSLGNRDELLAISSQIESLRSNIDEKQEDIKDLQHILDVERLNKEQTAANLKSLIKRINYQYNVDVEESMLFNVNKNNYDKIIYLKELTRVQYVDSFLYYLKEILKVKYSMPVRLLVIESFYAIGKVYQYPNLIPHYALKERDVISGDILMLGLQPKTMEDILKNASRISILIVLDRSGYKVPYIRGSNIEYFYSASDLKDVPETIPIERVISYSESSMYIPYITGFDEMDSSRKLKEYSSTKIMRQVIANIEGW